MAAIFASDATPRSSEQALLQARHLSKRSEDSALSSLIYRIISAQQADGAGQVLSWPQLADSAS